MDASTSPCALSRGIVSLKTRETPQRKGQCITVARKISLCSHLRHGRHTCNHQGKVAHYEHYCRMYVNMWGKPWLSAGVLLDCTWSRGRSECSQPRLGHPRHIGMSVCILESNVQISILTTLLFSQHTGVAEQALPLPTPTTDTGEQSSPTLAVTS